MASKLVPDSRHVNLSTSTSDEMSEDKFLGKIGKEDILMVMVEALEAAKSYGAKSIGWTGLKANATFWETRKDILNVGCVIIR